MTPHLTLACRCGAVAQTPCAFADIPSVIDRRAAEGWRLTARGVRCPACMAAGEAQEQPARPAQAQMELMAS